MRGIENRMKQSCGNGSSFLSSLYSFQSIRREQIQTPFTVLIDVRRPR